jgi:hypothetical protein
MLTRKRLISQAGGNGGEQKFCRRYCGVSRNGVNLRCKTTIMRERDKKEDSLEDLNAVKPLKANEIEPKTKIKDIVSSFPETATIFANYGGIGDGEQSVESFCFARGIDVLTVWNDITAKVKIEAARPVSNPQFTVEPKSTEPKCWFCGTGKPQKAFCYDVNLVKVIGKQESADREITTIQKTTVFIPRCEQCARTHDVRHSVALGVAIVICVLTLAGSMLAAEAITAWNIFISLIFSLLLAIGIYYGVKWAISKIFKTRNYSDVHNYPAIVELLTKGWSLEE